MIYPRSCPKLEYFFGIKPAPEEPGFSSVFINDFLVYLSFPITIQTHVDRPDKIPAFVTKPLSPRWNLVFARANLLESVVTGVFGSDIIGKFIQTPDTAPVAVKSFMMSHHNGYVVIVSGNVV